MHSIRCLQRLNEKYSYHLKKRRQGAIRPLTNSPPPENAHKSKVGYGISMPEYYRPTRFRIPTANWGRGLFRGPQH